MLVDNPFAFPVPDPLGAPCIFHPDDSHSHQFWTAPFVMFGPPSLRVRQFLRKRRKNHSRD